jgi:hypothetical protein
VYEPSVKPSKGDPSVEREKVVTIERPADLSDEGLPRVFSEGANLSLKNGEIRICAPQEGPVAVEAFVVEPDRPPRAGRLDPSARKIPRWSRLVVGLRIVRRALPPRLSRKPGSGSVSQNLTPGPDGDGRGRGVRLALTVTYVSPEPEARVTLFSV